MERTLLKRLDVDEAAVSPGQPGTMPDKCPVCGERCFTPFFELNAVPVQDGLLYPTKAEALAAPMGDIHLAYCQQCGYVGNQAFDFAKISYDPTYSFSLHGSATYQRFVESVAARLQTIYDLNNKSILEIACGQGDFLRLLCRLGNNRGYGVDPSLPELKTEQAGSYTVTFIPDFFGEQYADQVGDLVVCRHLLDQLDQPRSFLEMVRRTVGGRTDTVVYFEVPNATALFQELRIWNITYEKSSWFTPFSLANLFELSGFQVLAVAPCYIDGQYLGIEVAPHNRAARLETAKAEERQYFFDAIHAFAENYRAKVQLWKTKLAELERSGRRVLAWGAGAGAISFLNIFKIRELIPYVVDINPKRQDNFMPLTGQQVMAPAFIQEFRPEVIIVTNPTYEAEIRQQVADLGVRSDFISI